MAIYRELEKTADRLRAFGERECRGYSDLYELLALGMAEDEALVDIAAHARDGQPAANMIFGAVQFLILKGSDHPLAATYAAVGDGTSIPEQTFEQFRSFCLDHRDELVTILESRRVQTNEVGRCALLYPAFTLLASRVTRPLAIIEIGPSAGLNLNWHRFGYDYRGVSTCGDPDSPVKISTEVRGDHTPPIIATPDPPALSIGIDYSPIDVANEEDALWLRALVWPDQKARGERLRAAIDITRKHPVKLIEGDGVARTDEIIGEIAEEYFPCVFHTHALYQFPDDLRRLKEIVARHAESRDIAHLALEWGGGVGSHLNLVTYRENTSTEELLAVGHAHGKWIEWQGGSS